MASGSNASSQLPDMKSSRFSTLKLFKFGTKEKDLKPPPLPPKDPYYMHNKSYASLSPDSLSLPPSSPMSPKSNFQYPRGTSPGPNQSTMSLNSSAASMKSSHPSEPRTHSQPQKKEKGKSFLKFGKRSPKSPSSKASSAENGGDMSATEGDDQISLPWNFQHNIHVDEGYVGIPPSWATSLAEAGFTEDEIAAIQARRTTGSRSPGSQPTSSSNGVDTSKTAFDVASSSSSDASLKKTRQEQQTHQISSSIPYVSSQSSLSLSSTSHGNATPNRVPPPQRRPPSPCDTSAHNTSLSISISVDSHQSSGNGIGGSLGHGKTMTPGIEEARSISSLSGPSTPPRRVMHITNNASPSQPSSPPPAYGFSQTSYLEKKDRLAASGPSLGSPSFSYVGGSGSNSINSTPVKPGHRSSPSTDTSESGASSSSDASKSSPQRTPSRTKRTTALPPRLSLHKSSESTDLSLWSAALLSGISSGSLGAPSSTPQTSPQSETLAKPTTSVFNRPHPKDSKQYRLPAPARPIPPIVLSNYNVDDTDSPAPPTGWAEAAATARLSPSSPRWEQEASPGGSPLWQELQGIVSNEDIQDEEIYSAALTESYSPTIPFNQEVTSLTKASNDSRLALQQPERNNTRPMSEDYEGGDSFLGVGELRERANRDSSRSSSSTLSSSTVMGYTATATVVRKVSVVKRTDAYVIDKSKTPIKSKEQISEVTKNVNVYDGTNVSSPVGSTFTSKRPPSGTHLDLKHPPSPLSSHFGSEEESASGSTSSGSQSQDHPTPTTEAALDSPLTYYLDGTPSPDPSRVSFSSAPRHLKLSNADTFGPVQKEGPQHLEVDDDDDDDDTSDTDAVAASKRPTIVISDVPSLHPAAPMTSATTPAESPFQRYRGWLSEVVAPLEEFIDETVDPRDHYLDLQEIAEGESGSVFAARLCLETAHKLLKLPPLVKAKDDDDLANNRVALVAIKSVAILPTGSPKLVDLERELRMMKSLWHDNVLGFDSLYVDLVEDSLWIRMELMERSLADIVGLVGDGLTLHDRMIARFAGDVLNALEFLQSYNIAHRDVRSDNLLLNSQGVLKLTDFSNAVQILPDSPMLTDVAGVVYWQAPEVRSGPYNAFKVDVWSLGATVWEMAETEPPFATSNQLADRWPSLHQPELYSPAFHDFLRRCSEPASTRPEPKDLIKSPFISNACGRIVIQQLLSQCMAIEKVLQEQALQEPET
ncbi:hypothetical protein BDQ17DRAFT_1427513 [Cyathus striatus]|nr:hypothetical protein BDQ17DRAFT_1427513 [Cyathus striatus]